MADGNDGLVKELSRIWKEISGLEVAEEREQKDGDGDDDDHGDDDDDSAVMKTTTTQMTTTTTMSWTPWRMRMNDELVSGNKINAMMIMMMMMVMILMRSSSSIGMTLDCIRRVKSPRMTMIELGVADQRTHGWMDGQTHRLIETRGRI